jgi:methylmalonyl-CoA/ethylmalonyl-CoA epimerase
MSTIEFWHHHVGISVPDLDAAIRWYGEKLGFQLDAKFRIEAIPASCAFIQNGALRIELFQPDHPQPMPAARRAPDTDNLTHGNKHGAFVVGDVPALHEELQRRGVDIVWMKKMGDGAALFIRDNSGVILEFVQGAPPAALPATL